MTPEIEINKKVSSVVNLGFNILFAAIGGMALIIFQSISLSISNVEQNVSDLNIKVAVALSDNKRFSEISIDHEKRLRVVEKSTK